MVVGAERGRCVAPLGFITCLMNAGGIGSSELPPNPSQWLTDKLWGELVRLSSDVPGFEGLEETFREDQAGFKVSVPGHLTGCLMSDGLA